MLIIWLTARVWKTQRESQALLDHPSSEKGALLIHASHIKYYFDYWYFLCPTTYD